MAATITSTAATTWPEFRDSRDFVEGARPVVEQADDDGDYQGDASVRMVSPLLPVHSDGDVDNGLAAGVSTRKRRNIPTGVVSALDRQVGGWPRVTGRTQCRPRVPCERIDPAAHRYRDWCLVHPDCERDDLVQITIFKDELAVLLGLVQRGPGDAVSLDRRKVRRGVVPRRAAPPPYRQGGPELPRERISVIRTSLQFTRSRGNGPTQIPFRRQTLIQVHQLDHLHPFAQWPN